MNTLALGLCEMRAMADACIPTTTSVKRPRGAALPDRLLAMSQAAKSFALRVRKAQLLTSAGDIGVARIGRAVRIGHSDLQRFSKERVQRPRVAPAP